MMTLYTATGTYKLNTSGLPTVLANDSEYALDAHELLLWSSLAFRILTYQELKAEFYEKEKDLHILGEQDFDHYLNRLITRGLVVSGQDYTGVDALYNLIGHLHAQPIPSGMAVKTIGFFKLWLYRGLSFRKAASIFHIEKLDPLEKHVLSLLKGQTLSTAELILCLEKGKTSLRNTEDLMKCLYAEENTDCDSILTDGRMCESRYPVLTAIANLYLKQRITFQIV